MDITTRNLRIYDSSSSSTTTSMSEAEHHHNSCSSSSSSDSSDTDGPNDEENFRRSSSNFKKFKKVKKLSKKALDNGHGDSGRASKKRQNIIFKLINREKSGYFTNQLGKYRNDPVAFRMVPKRMRFCLNEIVPYCYLKGHVFMGLTVCGQFLLSYKISLNDEGITNGYNFNAEARYELYFWIYRPHCLLGKYYRVCLFDDHGVDNYKTVTMVQWINNPRTLIIHGVSGVDEGNSHITIVAVPKLGCLECKKMRDDYSDDYFRCDALCIKCNLTIHTKYSHTETDPKFIPETNLSLPNYIIMIGNGFIHVISVDLEVPKIIGKVNLSTMQNCSNEISSYVNRNDIMHHPSVMDDALAAATHPCNGGLATTMMATMMPAAVTATTGGNGYGVGCDKNNLSSGNNLEIVNSNSLVGCSASNLKKISHIEHHYKSDDISNLIYGCDSHKSNNNNVSSSNINHNKNSIVERIIADFAECETDTSSIKSDDNERIIALPKSTELTGSARLMSQHHSKLANKRSNLNRVPRLSNRIRMSRSSFLINGFVSTSGSASSQSQSSTISSSLSTTSSSQSSSSKQVYEFSEDTEKCEKISIFRKKRLAEKKYEFSDYNSENIIPFNINLRKRNLSRISASLSSGSSQATLPQTLPYQHQASTSRAASSTSNVTTALYSSQPTQYPLSYGLFNPAPPNYEVTSHLHRASPSHGFRSPCGSPVGNRCLRSPPGFTKSSYLNSRSPTYTMRSPTTNSLTLSPRQQQPKKTTTNTDFLNENSQNIYQLTDINGKLKTEYCDLPHGLMAATTANSDHPVCSKKFVRHFVEETDATSVITSEEDDCISPGYHTSLPMEVHGSCYSDMQMISQASYQRLKCPTVIITQNSFDLETFTFHVVNHLCTQNHKKKYVLYDWACEMIHVCQISNTITLLLMVHFTAIDHLTVESKQCINCSTNYNCVFHRKHFQCQTIFTWNIDTGNWNVIEYGELNEIPSTENTNELIHVARRIANELARKLDETTNIGSIYKNIRILDSNNEKSKNFILDKQNAIGFYRKRKNLHQHSQTSDYYLDDSSDTSY